MRPPSIPSAMLRSSVHKSKRLSSDNMNKCYRHVSSKVKNSQSLVDCKPPCPSRSRSLSSHLSNSVSLKSSNSSQSKIPLNYNIHRKVKSNCKIRTFSEGPPIRASTLLDKNQGDQIYNEVLMSKRRFSFAADSLCASTSKSCDAKAVHEWPDELLANWNHFKMPLKERCLSPDTLHQHFVSDASLEKNSSIIAMGKMRNVNGTNNLNRFKDQRRIPKHKVSERKSVDYYVKKSLDISGPAKLSNKRSEKTKNSTASNHFKLNPCSIPERSKLLKKACETNLDSIKNGKIDRADLSDMGKKCANVSFKVENCHSREMKGPVSKRSIPSNSEKSSHIIVFDSANKSKQNQPGSKYNISESKEISVSNFNPASDKSKFEFHSPIESSQKHKVPQTNNDLTCEKMANTILPTPELLTSSEKLNLENHINTNKTVSHSQLNTYSENSNPAQQLISNHLEKGIKSDNLTVDRATLKESFIGSSGIDGNVKSQGLDLIEIEVNKEEVKEKVCDVERKTSHSSSSPASSNRVQSCCNKNIPDSVTSVQFSFDDSSMIKKCSFQLEKSLHSLDAEEFKPIPISSKMDKNQPSNSSKLTSAQNTDLHNCREQALPRFEENGEKSGHASLCADSKNDIPRKVQENLSFADSTRGSCFANKNNFVVKTLSLNVKPPSKNEENLPSKKTGIKLECKDADSSNSKIELSSSNGPESLSIVNIEKSKLNRSFQQQYPDKQAELTETLEWAVKQSPKSNSGDSEKLKLSANNTKGVDTLVGDSFTESWPESLSYSCNLLPAVPVKKIETVSNQSQPVYPIFSTVSTFEKTDFKKPLIKITDVCITDTGNHTAKSSTSLNKDGNYTANKNLQNVHKEEEKNNLLFKTENTNLPLKSSPRIDKNINNTSNEVLKSVTSLIHESPNHLPSTFLKPFSPLDKKINSNKYNPNSHPNPIHKLIGTSSINAELLKEKPLNKNRNSFIDLAANSTKNCFDPSVNSKEGDLSKFDKKLMGISLQDGKACSLRKNYFIHQKEKHSKLTTVSHKATNESNSANNPYCLNKNKPSFNVGQEKCHQFDFVQRPNFVNFNNLDNSIERLNVNSNVSIAEKSFKFKNEACVIVPQSKSHKTCSIDNIKTPSFSSSNEKRASRSDSFLNLDEIKRKPVATSKIDDSFKPFQKFLDFTSSDIIGCFLSDNISSLQNKKGSFKDIISHSIENNINYNSVGMRKIQDGPCVNDKMIRNYKKPFGETKQSNENELEEGAPAVPKFTNSGDSKSFMLNEQPLIPPTILNIKKFSDEKCLHGNNLKPYLDRKNEKCTHKETLNQTCDNKPHKKYFVNSLSYILRDQTTKPNFVTKSEKLTSPTGKPVVFSVLKKNTKVKGYYSSGKNQKAVKVKSLKGLNRSSGSNFQKFPDDVVQQDVDITLVLTNKNEKLVSLRQMNSPPPPFLSILPNRCPSNDLKGNETALDEGKNELLKTDIFKVGSTEKQFRRSKMCNVPLQKDVSLSCEDFPLDIKWDNDSVVHVVSKSKAKQPEQCVFDLLSETGINNKRDSSIGEGFKMCQTNIGLSDGLDCSIKKVSNSIHAEENLYEQLPVSNCLSISTHNSGSSQVKQLQLFEDSKVCGKINNEYIDDTSFQNPKESEVAESLSNDFVSNNILSSNDLQLTDRKGPKLEPVKNINTNNCFKLMLVPCNSTRPLNKKCKVNEKEASTISKRYCRVRATSMKIPSEQFSGSNDSSNSGDMVSRSIWKMTSSTENLLVNKEPNKYNVCADTIRHKRCYRIRGTSSKHNVNKTNTSLVEFSDDKGQTSVPTFLERKDKAGTHKNTENALKSHQTPFIDPHIWKYVLLFQSCPVVAKEDVDVSNIKEIPDVSNRSVLDLFRSVDKTAVIIQKDFYTREKIMRKIKEEENIRNKQLPTTVVGDKIVKASEKGQSSNVPENSESCAPSLQAVPAIPQMKMHSQDIKPTLSLQQSNEYKATISSVEPEHVLFDCTLDSNEPKYMKYDEIFEKILRPIISDYNKQKHSLPEESVSSAILQESTLNNDKAENNFKPIRTRRNMFKNVVIFNSELQSEQQSYPPNQIENVEKLTYPSDEYISVKATPEKLKKNDAISEQLNSKGFVHSTGETSPGSSMPPSGINDRFNNLSKPSVLPGVQITIPSDVLPHSPQSSLPSASEVSHSEFHPLNGPHIAYQTNQLKPPSNPSDSISTEEVQTVNTPSENEVVKKASETATVPNLAQNPSSQNDIYSYDNIKSKPPINAAESVETLGFNNHFLKTIGPGGQQQKGDYNVSSNSPQHPENNETFVKSVSKQIASAPSPQMPGDSSIVKNEEKLPQFVPNSALEQTDQSGAALNEGGRLTVSSQEITPSELADKQSNYSDISNERQNAELSHTQIETTKFSSETINIVEPIKDISVQNTLRMPEESQNNASKQSNLSSVTKTGMMMEVPNQPAADINIFKSKEFSGNLLIKLKEDGNDALEISSYNVSFYKEPNKDFSILLTDKTADVNIAALVKQKDNDGSEELSGKDEVHIIKDNNKNPSTFSIQQSSCTTSINLKTNDSRTEVSVAQNSNTLEPGSSIPCVVKSYFQISGSLNKMRDPVSIVEAAKKNLIGIGSIEDPASAIKTPGKPHLVSSNPNNFLPVENNYLKASSGAYTLVKNEGKDAEIAHTNAKREYELSSSSKSSPQIDDIRPVISVSKDYPVINIQLQLAPRGAKTGLDNNPPNKDDAKSKLVPPQSDSYEDTIEKMRKKFIANTFRSDSSVAVNKMKTKIDEQKPPKTFQDADKELEDKKPKLDSFEYDPNSNPLNEKDLKLLENYFYAKNNPTKKSCVSKSKKSSKYSVGKGKGSGGKKVKTDPPTHVIDSVSKFKELIEKHAHENYMELSQYTFSIVSPSEFANALRPSSLNKVTPIGDVSEPIISSFSILRREDKELSFPTPVQGIINIELLSNPILKEKYAHVPSVSLILNNTMSQASKTALDKWKMRMTALMGEANFQEFYQAQLDRGKEFHEIVKGRLMGKPDPEEKSKKNLCLKSIEWVLKDVTDIAAVESFVLHPALGYKGILDCVAKYKDKPVLIEWKHSSKKKSKVSSTYDAPLQMSAYMGALAEDKNYNFQVDGGLVVVAHADGSDADLFEVEPADCQKYWTQWLQRLSHYTALHRVKPAIPPTT